jgi:hypothetical protein
MAEFVDPDEPTGSAAGRSNFVDPDESNVPADISGLSLKQKAQIAASNVPESYGRFLSQTGHAIMHPFETAQGMYQVASGSGQRLEDFYRQKMGLAPLATGANEEHFNAFKDYVKKNYGSMDAFQRHFMQDPVQAMADLSMIIQPTTGALPGVLKAAGATDRIVSAANLISKAGEYSNPLKPVTAPISAVAGRTAARPPAALSETEQAQKELAASGQPVDIPRYMSGKVARTVAVPLAKAPLAGMPIQRAADVIPEQIGQHIEDIAGQSSGKLSPDEVGAAIGQPLRDAAEREAHAARVRAQIEHDQAVAQWQRQQQEREGTIRGQSASVSAAADRQFGTIHPTRATEQTMADVRQAHDVDEAVNQNRWETVNQLNAPSSMEAFDNLQGRVDQGITNSGVTLGAKTTPVAMQMMDELKKLTREPGTPATAPDIPYAIRKTFGDNVPEDILKSLPGYVPETTGKSPDFRLLGEHAPAPGDTHISAQGIDALRKRMVQMANSAEYGSEDWRAANAVKRQVENWEADTFQNHLLPGGDPNANAVIRNAVTGHRQFMEKYGYNHYNQQGMDRAAARELNQIATGVAGPTDISGKLIGGQPGKPEVAHPLFKRIESVVQNPADLRTRMRAAYWRGTDIGSPQEIGKKIENLRNSPMGQELFHPGEHNQMQEVGRIRQQLAPALEQAKAAAGKAPLKPAVQTGPAQATAKLFTGTRSNEQIYRTFNNAFKTGPTAKFEEARDAWGRLPQAGKDEFRGAMLRNLGKDDAGNFTLDRFVSDWNDYADKAKQLIFINDPATLRNINNFHKIASDLKDAVKRYGNPPGTASAKTWMDLVRGVAKETAALTAGTITIGHPIALVASGVGAYGLSRLISSPRGIKTMNNWNTLAKAYNRAPTASKLNALSAMSRDLQNQATGQ